MIDAVSMLVAVLVVGVAAAFVWTRFDEGRRPRLLCLMYHRFATPEEYSRLSGTERVFTVPVPEFDRQLAMLEERGFRPVTTREAVEFVNGNRTLPESSVLITIDDGCRSVMTHAEPVLRRRGFSATLFVTTDENAYVFDTGDGQQRLTDDELADLDPSVVDVQSHGVTHRPLVTLGYDELQHELTEGKAELQRVTGRSIDYLAIPGNWHDRRVRKFARKAGFEGVFVSDAGTNRFRGDPYRIRRINVEGNADTREFASRLTSSGTAGLRFLAAIKRAPGRLLGPRAWLPLRAFIRRFVGPEVLSFRSLRLAGLALSVLVVAFVIVRWILR